MKLGHRYCKTSRKLREGSFEALAITHAEDRRRHNKNVVESVNGMVERKYLVRSRDTAAAL